ncbi:MAG: hypothetical protein ACXVPQ_05600, partial [Bacteroidia bacterium]
MKALILKLTVFLCIVFALLKLLDAYYTRYTFAHLNVCQKPYWLLAQTGQHPDFAFIGNSRVYNMVDVKLIEAKTKKQGINLGMTGTNYSELYLAFDQFLKNKNTLKNLIIQVDLMSLNAKKVNFSLKSHMYMHLLNDTTVMSVYKDNVPMYRYMIWKYVPFVKYMEYSNHFVFYKILKGGFECKTFDGLDTTKGTVFLLDHKYNPGNKFYWTVDQTDETYFKKLIHLAKQHNINVILYTAPVGTTYLHGQLNYKAVMQRIKDIAAEEHIAYFDFSRPEIPFNKD